MSNMEKVYFELDEDFNSIIKNTLKDEEIKRVDKISTGWTNIVYNVETDKGEYFFRFPRDEFWARTIVKDCEFAKYIHGKTDFNTVNLQLKYDKNNRPFSMHKKIEGTALAEKMDNLTPEEQESVSKDIAKFMYQLHNIKYDKKDIFDVNNIGLDLKDFLDELLKLHIDEDNRKFWNTEKLVNNREKNCLVHGDLNSSNILIDNNNKVTAFIDFGFGGFGDKYDDISRIIGRTPNQFKDKIIKNYEDFNNRNIDIKILDNKIDIWNKIDNAYIGYMKKIGIYE